MLDRLRLVVRTPHETTVDRRVRSARVPTESGQLGLRPREEPLVLAIEPGLIAFWVDDGIGFAATVGGLLQADREHAEIYTPFAVAGTDEEQVLAALDRALETPGSEITARRRLGELEERIAEQLRRRPASSRKVARDG